jgi:hypothetical protein
MNAFVRIFLLLTFSLSAFHLSRAQSFPDAGAYMSFIGTQHQEITKDMWSYTSAVAHGKSARKVENRRQELLKTLTDARRKIATMPAWQGDKSLRDSTAKYLLTSFHILNEDYGKLVNLEDVAEQSYDAMEAYLLAQELAHDKLNAAGEQLEETQKSFAARQNIRLIENEDKVSAKLSKANTVTSYHRVVYLIFFKSYKQEFYLMDAIMKKNINAIEQNNNTLEHFAREGMARLDTIAAYSGDKSLVSACRQMIEFYQQESKEKIPALTSFYLQEENFTKMKKAFDAKRPAERTQADVDQFNKAANELNKAGSDFNALNKQLYENRKKLLENWNKTAQAFMDKHTPKYR